MNEFTPFLTRLALDSGALLRSAFAKSNLKVDTKPDRTVVTQADRDTESYLRDRIRDAHPSHGVIGEEFGNDRPDAEFVWVIDPIDGTLSFIHGVPLFTTLIGLLHQGRPVLGAIHQPVLERLALGDNTTASLNGKPTRIRPCHALSRATLCITDPNLVPNRWNAKAWQSVQRKAATFRTWGDGFGYLSLATGRCDAMLDPVMNPWDLLPLIPVVRGAGAIITSWDGKAPESAASALAASPELHAKLLAALNPADAARIKHA